MGGKRRKKKRKDEEVRRGDGKEDFVWRGE
jgi:hypothetical protein